ncbi:MAG: HAMP domain-containing histidine kinase [Bacteroidetes bacterium]|nr:HAMP domain-containing histidine kinase [Bacteroidota bacterium]
MIPAWFNWRTGVAVLFMAIALGTIFYSQYLAKKIEDDEKAYVELWKEAVNYNIQSKGDDRGLELTSRITNQNNRIPIIQTDEKGRPIGIPLNMGELDLQTDSLFIQQKIAEFKKQRNPIRLVIESDPPQVILFYYGDSDLLNQVRYYPLIQLGIVGLFIFITLNALSTRHRSQQNQVWAGMAKETAHQLGTPVSSLEAWVEMLREDPTQQKLANELGKDVARLRLVSDRFGKIGSKPQLEELNPAPLLELMIEYMRGRSSDKVQLQFEDRLPAATTIKVSATLFDWVIENLIRNALDALDGSGSIEISLDRLGDKLFIDVADTGKGIASALHKKIFEPGFSTKKRGWGLGLSLAKRIVEQYHGGQLQLLYSELGKGTRFRIVLNAKTT